MAGEVDDLAGFEAPLRPDPAALRPAVGERATTDRGTPVSVYTYHHDRDLAPTLAASEESTVRSRSMALQAIRTAPPDTVSNCHGWVFTGGRYWVVGRDVETILRDNGYRPVAAPRGRDVVVYRDESGTITHTGLVLGVRDDGSALVESKWSWLGRYVHAPEAQPFGTQIAYYRTDRPGHLVHFEPSAGPKTHSPEPAGHEVLGGGQ
jgi:hypothetical protein